MGLNNPLRNFTGEQERAFRRLWALSFGKKQGQVLLMIFWRAGVGFEMEDFLTALTALDYATAHMSLTRLQENCFGAGNIFLFCLSHA